MSSVKTLSYDPGFEPAVREGFLSRREAMARGNRNAFAEDLARRHRLPLDLAWQVADQRVHLHQVMLRVGRIAGLPSASTSFTRSTRKSSSSSGTCGISSPN